MKRITMSDIHKRVKYLKLVELSDNRIFYFNESSSNPLEIKRIIESAVKSNSDISINTYISLFDSLCESNASESDIEKIGSFIAEEAIPKIRNAKQTLTLLKRRLGRINSKNKNAINKKRNQKPNYSNKSKVKKENAYIKMINSATVYMNCDRMIENYNKISKRYNLDQLFIENSRINGIYDTVVELCKFIDTYDMPNYVKFNTVIETSLYGFDFNNIDFDRYEVLESALDYFMFKENWMQDCKEILDSTLFFDKDDDMKNIDIITEEEPEENNNETIKESIESFIGFPYNITINENVSFNDMFKKFKNEELGDDASKVSTKLKSLIIKLYSQNVDGIIEGTPDLLKWIRTFFIIGTGAVPFIGPILSLVGIIADRFLSLHIQRNETEKMLKCFNNEIKASKDKLKTTTDSNEKKRLEKYIKSLEDAREKIDDYYSELLSDDEKYNRPDDSDYNDFSFDDDFYECAILKEINNSIEDIIKINQTNPLSDTCMYNLVSELPDEDLVNISTIAAKYPETFYKEAVYRGLKDNLSDIRNNIVKFESIVDKSLRLNVINKSIYIIENTKNIDIDDLEYVKNSMECIKEVYDAINIFYNANENRSQLLEASISNTLKLASMKLKNAITKLKDKERQVSQSIDVNMNSFTKNVERALTNDNRESIIKGSILPSASKMVKLGIVNAGLTVIGQPVLAIITTLGYLGASAKFKAKERQMVIDELEIELKMCEKYIDIAESKNDTKALKQLLTTQRELQRQLQRIKYKMNVKFGQKYYNAKTDDE